MNYKFTDKIHVIYIFLFCFNYLYSASLNSLGSLYKQAYSYLGTPYVWGGEDINGLDCSGLTQQLYEKVFGFELPRIVKQQVQEGDWVTGSLLPGDLLFFNTTGTVSHVGIYLGASQFIHSSSYSKNSGVIRSSLDEAYFSKCFVGAKRILAISPEHYSVGDIWTFQFESPELEDSQWLQLIYYKNGKAVLSKRKKMVSNQIMEDEIRLNGPGLWTAVLFDESQLLVSQQLIDVDGN